MKKHLALFVAILILMVNVGIAQAQQTVYTDGNVRIVQNTDGWQIILGNTVMAFGDGAIDLDNMPPAFKDILDAYAKMDEPKEKKTLSKAGAAPTKYGPLLTTAWNQGAPYNNQCPKIKYTENGVEKTGYTLVGCSSVSTAQILNYYGYCNQFSETEMVGDISFATGENDNPADFELVESEFFYKDNGKNKYKFPVYTPDFGLIASDKNELAKFLLGIGLVQKAAYGIGVTWTNTKHQIAALKTFGYNIQQDNGGNEDITISDLTDDIVVNAIKAARPIIIGSSNKKDGGHSYIIDGYNTNDYVHIDYGYNGDMNGWFKNISATKFPENPSVIIAYPNVENNVPMRAESLMLAVDGNDDIQLEGNGLRYKSAPISLTEGEHTFYFYYGVDDKIAPYTASASIVLGKNNISFTKRGCFTSTPAKIILTEGCDIVFCHDVSKGEISVEVSESEPRTIAGKVVDENNKAIEGAIIFATASGEPEIASENTPDHTIDQHGRSAEPLLIDFVPQKDYITGFNLYVIKRNNPTKKLNVAIVSSIEDYNNPEIVWSQDYLPELFSENEYVCIDQQFDTPIKVTKGQTYYIMISNMVQDKDNGIRYYCKIDENRSLIYKVFGIDGYATTDAEGKYSLSISNYWSGTLSAQYKYKTFNTIGIEASSSGEDYNFSTDGSEKYGALSITIGKDGKKHATLDGNYSGTDGMSIPEDIEVASVTLNRQLTKGVYSTIILPFYVETSEITCGTFYSFTGIKPEGDKWVADVTEQSSLAANTPYIFKANDNVNSLTWNVKKTLIKTPSTISTPDKDPAEWIFKGVYQKKVWYKQTPTDYGFAGTKNDDGISIGDFVRAGNGTSIKPFRCYLTYVGNNQLFLSKSAIELPESIEVRVVEPEDFAEVIEPDNVDSTFPDDFETPTSEIVPNGNQAKVWSFNRTIFIETVPGTEYTIIDIAGRPLINGKTNSSHEEVVLPGKSGGVVMVWIANKAYKVQY